MKLEPNNLNQEPKQTQLPPLSAILSGLYLPHRESLPSSDTLLVHQFVEKPNIATQKRPGILNRAPPSVLFPIFVTVDPLAVSQLRLFCRSYNLAFSRSSFVLQNLKAYFPANAQGTREIHISADWIKWPKKYLDTLAALEGNRVFSKMEGSGRPAARSPNEFVLQVIDINSAIPRAIGGFDMLKTLSLSSCGLTGQLPRELGLLLLLESLDLSRNNLIGVIPEHLGNLRNLTLLNLSWNQLTGQVPRGLANLPKLAKLDVRGNSGMNTHIPAEVVALHPALRRQTCFKTCPNAKCAAFNNARTHTKREVAQHMLDVHGGECQFSEAGNLCHFDLKRIKDLSNIVHFHFNQMHGDSKQPIVCTSCGKKFVSASTLRKHTRLQICKAR